VTKAPKIGQETTLHHYTYDAWNRLVKVYSNNGGLPGNIRSTYEYNGIGYRSERTFSGDNDESYYSNDHQILETLRNNDAQPLDAYVYDIRYVDEAIVGYRDNDLSGTVDNTYYLTHDANYNVTAIVSGGGTVTERYNFAPYGERKILDASYATDADGISDVDFSLGHQGLWHDEETGLVYNRARMLHMTLGRFMQRDPLGYVDGNNLAQYESSSPINTLDPTGLIVRHVGPVTSPMLPPLFPNAPRQPVAPGDPMDNLSSQLANFLTGSGSSITFVLGEGSQLASQLWNNHRALAPFKHWLEAGAREFCNCGCPDNSTYWSGHKRVQFTATGSDFIEDVGSLLLAGGSDGQQWPNLRIQWLGSFTLTYQASIDCSSNSVEFRGTVSNSWSIQSLTRNPVTGHPLVNPAQSRRVNQEITIVETGKACG